MNILIAENFLPVKSFVRGCDTFMFGIQVSNKNNIRILVLLINYR